ncbi:stalk domain-containing protein [Paenibacillus sp. GCM10028914]|uniref:stalk domain-containing protein n=1 Tax=Paenibacillus sp. GCM10028914 TaxID=3273416 RepID=UPI00361831C3
MRKISVTSLLLLLVLVLIPSSAFSAKSATPTGLSFPDPVLEMVVRHYINKPTGTITQKDVDKITVLDTNSVHAMLVDKLKKPGASSNRVGIKSLKGISQLRNLETLRIEMKHNPATIMHTIKDLSELKSLKKLKKLTLSGVSLESLRGMEGLTGLISLDVSSNIIQDLTPIQNLTKLEQLNLSWNQLNQGTNGLTPLKNLKKLKTLNLYMNSMEDISPLSQLTGLQELTLGGSGNGNLKDLSTLKNLRKLNIDYFNATNLKPLKELTKLQELSMVYNRVSDLTPLAGLQQLQILNLSENQVKSLKPIENLKEIRIIKAGYNQIESLAPLTKWSHLKQAEFQYNRIASVEGLENKKNLKSINLENNIIDIRSGNASATILTGLKEQGTKVSYTEFVPFPDILLIRKSKSAYAFGKYIELPAAPFERQGRTFVPLRVISDLLGADVQWNKTDQTVTIGNNGDSIILTVGSAEMLVNGESVITDSAPIVIGDTTYVPIRFIAAQLGMIVKPNGTGISINKI